MNRQHIFGDAFFWVRFNFLQEGGAPPLLPSKGNFPQAAFSPYIFNSRPLHVLTFATKPSPPLMRIIFCAPNIPIFPMLNLCKLGDILTKLDK